MTEFDNKSIITENTSIREDIKVINSAVKTKQDTNRSISGNPLDKLEELKRLIANKHIKKINKVNNNTSIDNKLQNSFVDSKNEEIKSVDKEPIKKEEKQVEKPLIEEKKQDKQDKHDEPKKENAAIVEEIRKVIIEPALGQVLENPKPANPFDEEPMKAIKNLPEKLPGRPGVANPKPQVKEGIRKAPIAQKPKHPEIKKIPEITQKPEIKHETDNILPQSSNPFDEPPKEVSKKLLTPKIKETPKSEPKHEIAIQQKEEINHQESSEGKLKQHFENNRHDTKQEKIIPLKEEAKEVKPFIENKSEILNKVEFNSCNLNRQLQTNAIESLTPFNTPMDLGGNIIDTNTQPFNNDIDFNMFSSRIDMKASFINPLDVSTNKSTFSVFRDNLDKIKGELRYLKENKHTTETFLDLATKKNEIYEKEIHILRQTVHQLRSELSKTNEEHLKLEISKVSQIINNKEKENHIITQENLNLKVQFKRMQENFENLIEENKRFRVETEKKFELYNQEIDYLKKMKCADSPKIVEHPVVIPGRSDSFTNGNPNVREDAEDFQMNGNTYDANGENANNVEYNYREDDNSNYYDENNQDQNANDNQDDEVNYNEENNQEEENIYYQEEDVNQIYNEENNKEEDNNYEQEDNNYKQQDDNNYEQEDSNYEQQQEDNNYEQQQEDNNYEQQQEEEQQQQPEEDNNNQNYDNQECEFDQQNQKNGKVT
jgi:hypothetical protein